MRATLEQLKALTPQELFSHWCSGAFPFEYLRSCSGGCLTMHASRKCEVHRELEAETTRMGFEVGRHSQKLFIPILHANLEELYALRLFYDSLYPQPAPELIEAVAIEEARIEVCEKHLTGAGAGHEL